jgi:hypothetical protein
MAGLFDRLGRFARSPQGKKLMKQAERIAKDPNTRRRIADVRAKLSRR